MTFSDDAVIDFENALIQHGKYNGRVYLIKMGAGCSPNLAGKLIEFAHSKGYSKIFAKVPWQFSRYFLDVGFVVEAQIPNFYKGVETAVFFAYYLSPQRAIDHDNSPPLSLETRSADVYQRVDRRSFEFRSCLFSDIPAMAKIYRAIFATYPFPIQDPHYLKKLMQDNVEFFGAEADGELVALASSEKDLENENVEMTDFATLSLWQGWGLGGELLKTMEKRMAESGIKTAYSISRAASLGINAIFSRAGYSFGGKLINNTNISGKIESMNVWYKSIQAKWAK